MRAKVTVPFTGLGDEDSEPKGYKTKQEITGNLAYQAVRAGAAEWIDPPNTAEADALKAQSPSKYPIEVRGKGDKPEGEQGQPGALV